MGFFSIAIVYLDMYQKLDGYVFTDTQLCFTLYRVGVIVTFAD